MRKEQIFDAASCCEFHLRFTPVIFLIKNAAVITQMKTKYTKYQVNVLSGNSPGRFSAESGSEIL